MVLVGWGQLGLSFPGDSAGAAAAEVEKLDVMKMTEADIDSFLEEFFAGCDVDGSGRVSKAELTSVFEDAMSMLGVVDHRQHDASAEESMRLAGRSSDSWSLEEFKRYAGQYFGASESVDAFTRNLHLIRTARGDESLYRAFSPTVDADTDEGLEYISAASLRAVLSSFLPTTGVVLADDWVGTMIQKLQETPAAGGVPSFRRDAPERGSEAQVTFLEFHGLMNALREKGADVSGLRAYIAASAGAAS